MNSENSVDNIWDFIDKLIEIDADRIMEINYKEYPYITKDKSNDRVYCYKELPKLNEKENFWRVGIWNTYNTLEFLFFDELSLMSSNTIYSTKELQDKIIEYNPKGVLNMIENATQQPIAQPKLYVKKFHPCAEITRDETKADMYDLGFYGLNKVEDKFKDLVSYSHSSEILTYKKGAIFRVALGVGIRLQEGKRASVHPRSSTRKNYGVLLTNCEGIIDHSYQGNDDQWLAEFYAIEDGEMKIGERILQFEEVDIQPKHEIIYVDTLESESRGGYGTSGK